MSPLQHILSIILLMVNACSSLPSDCNYVVDMWIYSAKPPTISPTRQPSPSPTMSPTDAPISNWINVTERFATTGEQYQESKFPIYNLESTHVSLALALLYSTFTFNYCSVYNGVFPERNMFAIKYECIGDNLIRKIYWDSTACDDTHTDIQMDEFLSTETHFATAFLCDQSIDCNGAYVRTLTANTTLPLGDDKCGPSDTPTMDMVTLYPHNICMAFSELPLLNELNTSDDYEFSAIRWSCAGEGTFSYGLSNDSNCTVLTQPLTTFVNNSCVGSLWTYVECNYNVDDTTVIENTKMNAQDDKHQNKKRKHTNVYIYITVIIITFMIAAAVIYLLYKHFGQKKRIKQQSMVDDEVDNDIKSDSSEKEDSMYDDNNRIVDATVGTTKTPAAQNDVMNHFLSSSN